MVAERLSEVVRGGDTVARLSGDIFMLLLPGVGTAETAGVLTEKLLAAIARPGAARGPGRLHDRLRRARVLPRRRPAAEHLLRNADSALHRAKDNGPGHATRSTPRA